MVRTRKLIDAKGEHLLLCPECVRGIVCGRECLRTEKCCIIPLESAEEKFPDLVDPAGRIDNVDLRRIGRYVEFV